MSKKKTITFTVNDDLHKFYLDKLSPDLMRQFVQMAMNLNDINKFYEVHRILEIYSKKND